MATASWLDPTTRQARLWKKHDLLALPHTVHKLEVALLLLRPALRGQRVFPAALARRDAIRGESARATGAQARTVYQPNGPRADVPGPC